MDLGSSSVARSQAPRWTCLFSPAVHHSGHSFSQPRSQPNLLCPRRSSRPPAGAERAAKPQRGRGRTGREQERERAGSHRRALAGACGGCGAFESRVRRQQPPPEPACPGASGLLGTFVGEFKVALRFRWQPICGN